MNQNRTALILNGPLGDKIENTPQALQGIKFAEGFRGITDLQFSPYDDYLYVVSLA